MLKAKELTFDEVFVGDETSFDFLVSEEFVNNFASLSGDYNPIHLDDEYAAQTVFGQKIGYGMISGILFSRLIGMELPGKYSVYLSQNITFHEPLKIGSMVIVQGKVVQKVESMKVIALDTHVYDKESKSLLVSGRAMAKVLK